MVKSNQLTRDINVRKNGERKILKRRLNMIGNHIGATEAAP